MAFSGEDKEMRMSANLAYTNLENLDHHSLVQQQQQQQEKPPPQNSHHPERFSESIGGGNSQPLNSTRSKPLKPLVASTSPVPISRTIYRECLKNHAASVGGNVTDGCGEFMPSGEDGTLEALKCAACNCHRNFHRREMYNAGDNNNAIVLHHHHLQLPSSLTSLSLNHHRKVASTPEGGGGHHWAATMAAQPVKMTPPFGAGCVGSGSVATDSSSEELNFNTYQSSAAVSHQPPPPFGLSKKRYRTKFSQEQKEKMLEFAEKLGWRIPREDDSEVQRFCGEVGVKRQVFKVWMHNNKSSSSSKKSNNNTNNNDNNNIINNNNHNNSHEPLNMMNS